MAKRKHDEPAADGDYGPAKCAKAKSVRYGDVTVFYFQRVQSFSCVPSLGGIALGLASRHCYSEQKALCDDVDDDVGDDDDGGDDDDSSDEKLGRSGDMETLTSEKRKKLLRIAGVRSWKKNELKRAREIRLSRLNCGCNCGDFCFPQTCSCSLNGISCQVDEGTFPCSCRPNCCLNAEGRQEYDALSISRHRTETLSRVGENTES